jgi:hypothetical protein
MHAAIAANFPQRGIATRNLAGYLRYVAFSSRSVLDVGNSKESRA